MSYKTYLAGNMTGNNVSEMKDWRDYAKSQLEDCIDPTTTSGTIEDYYSGKTSPEEIINQDLNDIDKCSFMIVNYQHDRPMVGTSMEMFFGKTKSNPCYVFTIVPDKSVVSPWLLHFSTKVFELGDYTVEQTIDKIIKIINSMKLSMDVANNGFITAQKVINDLLKEDG